ncbi:spore coat protein [Oceanobacillus piezotolerans]|uniref:Spore coat protein n=2 Tax=Oceanobacillus piezotolerans TaxID=2448030 RepID=A0A498DRS1_9BACI|nr:spore coat protein [Oceanobacillus piezotolerans]
MPDKNRFENCVEEVLEAILRAQNKVKQDDHCKTSCENSIDDLRGEKQKAIKNTIPIILYCGCDPFKGTGVVTYSSCKDKSKKKFKCIDSFIFKIKELKGKCAVLELLAFRSDLKYSAVSKYDCCGHRNSSPYCQIDKKCADDLIKTGICINVDLSCFCAVTCLPAVKL